MHGVALARRAQAPKRYDIATGVLLGALLSAGVARADTDPLDPTLLPVPALLNYGEVETARSAAMGGAVRSTASGTLAPFANPAGLAMSRVYHVEAIGQFAPEVNRHFYGATVADSVTSKLAGAVSVGGGLLNPSGLDRNYLDVRIALAYPLTQRIFLGLSGRYLKGKIGGKDAPFPNDYVAGGLLAGPMSTVDPPTRETSLNAFTFDAGFLAKLGDSVFLSVVGQNLTLPKSGMLPTTVGFGVAFARREFSVEADGAVDFTSFATPKARAMLGGEYLIGDHVPIRLGYRFDHGPMLHTLSGGVGYIGRQFSVEAGVKRTVSSPGITTVLLSVAYFLEASGAAKAAPPPEEAPLSETPAADPPPASP